jgi:PAS domain S-box-containing protein
MTSVDMLVQPNWEAFPFSIAIIGYDRSPSNRKILYINSTFVKLTGYSSEEALGKPAGLLDGAATDEVTVEECETALGKGVPFTRLAKHYRKDGSEYLSQYTVAPLLEPDGHAAFLITMEMEAPPSRHGGVPGYWRQGSSLIPLTLPMPLKEFSSGQLPTHLPSHPELKALRDLWASLAVDGELPRRSKLDLEVMKRWASHLSIAAVLPGGRF